MKRPLLLLPMVTLLLACGGGDKPPPNLPAPPKPDKRAVTEQAPDVSEMPEPQGLVATGFVRSPAALLDKLGKISQFPLPGASHISRLLTVSKTEAFISLTEPALMALGVSGKGLQMRPRFVASVVVTNLDAAKRALASFRVTPGPNATYKIEGLGKADEEDGERVCALMPAFGAATPRLVCGDAASVDELGPYVTRTLPRVAFPADVHLELRSGAMRGELERQKGLVSALLTSALGSRLSHVGQAEVQDLAREVLTTVVDLETVVLDLAVDDKEIRPELTLSFATDKSAFSHALTEGPDRTAPPNPFFWNLPKEATFALSGRGSDPQTFARMRSLLTPLLAPCQCMEELLAEDKKRIDEATAKVLTAAPLVYGHGFEPKELDAGLSALRTKKGKVDGTPLVLSGLLGFHLVGIQAPPKEILSGLEALVATWNRPSVQKVVKASMGDIPPPALRRATTPKELSKDSTHFRLETVTLIKDAKKKLEYHLFVVPQGDTTWLAFGMGEKTLVEKVLSLSGSDAGKLTSRQDLASLRAQKGAVVGYASQGGPVLFGLAGLFARLGRGDFAGIERGVSAMRSLPSSSAIPFVVSPLDNKRTQVRVSLSKEALDTLTRGWLTAAIDRPAPAVRVYE